MSCFVAHLSCPLCTWASVSSAPTYGEAEKRVSEQLMLHLEAQHPAPEAEPRPVTTSPGVG